MEKPPAQQQGDGAQPTHSTLVRPRHKQANDENDDTNYGHKIGKAKHHNHDEETSTPDSM